MSVKELKGSMVDLLAQVNDQALLERMYGLMQEMLAENLDKTDWWDELSPDVQKEFEAALEESKYAENLIGHEVVANQVKRWLNE